MTIETQVIAEIEAYLDAGYTDKQEIYNKIVEQLKIPRPTVRRIARTLRNRYLQRIKILQSDIPDFTTEKKPN